MRIILIVSLFIFITNINIAWSFSLNSKPLPYAAPDASFTSNNKQFTLANYKGKKVMLWLFSTWCHTCVASLKALRKMNAELIEQGVTIIALKNYKNGGYPGPSIIEFIQKFEPKVLNLDNWVIGNAGEDLDNIFNKKKFPDVYFLIDKQANVQIVDTAPNLTRQIILNFATDKTK